MAGGCGRSFRRSTSRPAGRDGRQAETRTRRPAAAGVAARCWRASRSSARRTQDHGRSAATPTLALQEPGGGLNQPWQERARVGQPLHPADSRSSSWRVASSWRPSSSGGSTAAVATHQQLGATSAACLPYSATSAPGDYGFQLSTSIGTYLCIMAFQLSTSTFFTYGF